LRNFIYDSSSVDGWENLAVDEWLLDHVSPQDLVLYFYQNENAVVIGKNQNPWVECDREAMERDGVQLVRRISGGGAVYHDLGNLNFSFLAGKERYDLSRQIRIISRALSSFGIQATFSGRNDLICNGKKVSGNAFAVRREKYLHHGTLLIRADLDRLQSYLTVDPRKIRSKGIDSVRSRVSNLSEISPEINVKSLKKAIVKEWEKEVGYWAEFQFSSGEKKEIASLCEKYASHAWQLDQTPKFDLEWNERFSWGGVQLFLSFERGKISAAKAFSDAMDSGICQELEEILLQIPFQDRAIALVLSSSQKSEIREMASCRFVP